MTHAAHPTELTPACLTLHTPVQLELDDHNLTPIYLQWWEELMNLPLDQRKDHWVNQPCPSPWVYSESSPSRVAWLHEGKQQVYQDTVAHPSGSSLVRFMIDLDGATLHQIRELMIANLSEEDIVSGCEVDMGELAPRARLDCPRDP